MESFQLTPDAIRKRRAAFVHAELKVMQQRIDVRRRDIRTVREIVGGVESDRGIAPLLPAHRMIVRVGVDLCVPHVVVLRIVEQVVDTSASPSFCCTVP